MFKKFEIFQCILLTLKRESENLTQESETLLYDFMKVDKEMNLFTLLLNLILKILYSCTIFCYSLI